MLAIIFFDMETLPIINYKFLVLKNCKNKVSFEYLYLLLTHK